MKRERIRLILARQARSWPQYHLADLAEIHASLLSRIEQALQCPSENVALRLARVLSLPPHFLFPDLFSEEDKYGAESPANTKASQ